MITENETKQLKDHLPFWNHLGTVEKDLILETAVLYHHEKGTLIHGPYYECIGLIYVQKGTLRVYILSEDGREITLFRIQEGEATVMGAGCVLHDISYDVYIEAATDCELIQVNNAAFAKILAENIYVEAFSYKMSTASLADALWTLQQVLFLSFDKRLAIFLLDEANATGTTTIKMTQEEIAKLTGSAREVVSRMLNYFASEGYVELGRGVVHLVNKEALKELVMD
ncbi:CRP/FNR family transcriptional regulator [Lachnospiraceae bacterium PF1-21]|uniref:Crp/Fnr family transcriptional regulator n=1 Tax=Ohessyouella blattaphilus TaxID=2949333 RepID=UPI003E22FAD0